ncbi:MAG: hypothetical protein IPL53_12890 [Ignavibacteria bacterium]|nr:hypothetical protein [Ignavibacteria bacterium]
MTIIVGIAILTIVIPSILPLFRIIAPTPSILTNAGDRTKKQMPLTTEHDPIVFSFYA